MALPEPTRLHMAFRARLTGLRALAVAQVLAAPDPDAAVPVVLDAQRNAVAATDAYLSLEAGLATATSTAAWQIDPEPLIGRAARGGALLEDVYGRNWAAPESTFAERMRREVNTDITLAERSATWVHTDGDPRIVGTRRVVGSANPCALCIVAATRTYQSHTLRPIHAHCGCSTQPIYQDGPAPTVDRRYLDSLYERAGSTRATDLSRLRPDPAELPAGVRAEDLPAVAVTATPELGPTLIAA